MLKILHTGDIHLDCAFSSLSPDEARERRAESRELFSKVIDTANTENVDAIILAGDIFDAYPIRPETAEGFLRDLKRAKAPVFITPGNHDPYTPDSPYRTLVFPDNVHIFTEEALSFTELPEKQARIWGAAYGSEVYDGRILDGFSVPDDGYINILVLHSNLYTDGYSPVSADEIAASGADYVALAHVHKPTELLKAGRTHYAYCGCLEAHDFGECYDSGFYIVTIDNSSVTLNRRSVSDISYREMSLNLTDCADVENALPSPVGRVHLRLTLTGECATPDVDALYEKLSPKYAELQIIDKTVPPRNLWEGLGEDTLRGVFLTKMKTLLDESADEEEREKVLLAVRYGINAIENREM